MQNFIDTVTNQIWSFDDDVSAEEINGVYAFKTAAAVSLDVPSTLQPYTVPPPTEAELVAAAQVPQIAALQNAYNAAIQSPVAYTSKAGVTKTYQATPQSVANLTQMLLAFQASGSVPTGFYWVAADNTQVPFSYADMQGLAEALGAQGAAAFQTLQPLKQQVNEASTVEAVQAVVWPQSAG